MKMRLGYVIGCLAFLLCACRGEVDQRKQEEVNDVTSPLHLLEPEYTVPYGRTTVDSIRDVVDRVVNYLETTTPAALVDKHTGQSVRIDQPLDSNVVFEKGDFRLTSYEWGVTYTGMLLLGDVTGDERYTRYTLDRVNLIADVAHATRENPALANASSGPVHSVLHPRALDDSGSLCASMIKAMGTGGTSPHLQTVVDHFIDYIMTGEFRLADGTLARNRPQANTLWLDDLYMSLPALVQMGKRTGDDAYFDEAVRQYFLFADRMFNAEFGLYMHGWVQDMEPHPEFRWARANGWALLTKLELLSALPAQHPARGRLLERFKAHVNGLVALQDGTGFWHQLLDRNDTYLETSATAIYAYCIAHGINTGWLDVKAYGPAALQAWNAVSTQVNPQGQVEGTCVGTGMAFDAAFYYHRPVNKYAAHGYGPVLLAGAEMMRLLSNYVYEINDSSVQFID